MFGVEVPDVSDFLGGEEDSGLVEEEVEEMRGKGPGVLGVEGLDVLVEEVEGLDALAIHLLLDFVEDLVGFVFPVHDAASYKINLAPNRLEKAVLIMLMEEVKVSQFKGEP